jgi:hypothetical protein
MRTEVVEAAKGDEVVDMDIYVYQHAYIFISTCIYIIFMYV